MYIYRTSEWKKVPPPSGWTWDLPFDIQKRGRKFRPDPTWDISAQVSRTGGNYYVSKTGNDTTGNGLSWETSWKTLVKASTALTNIDNACLYVGAGRYGWNEAGTSFNLTRNKSIIGVGQVVIDNALPLTWTLTSGRQYTYEATYAGPAGAVVDWNHLNDDGTPIRYDQKTTINDVEATAGSYMTTSNSPWVTYVHTLDNNTPNSDVRPVFAGTWTMGTNATNIYLENLIFIQQRLVINASLGTSTLYMKNCRVLYSYISFTGNTAYFRDCLYRGYITSDSAQMDLVGGSGHKLVEIDCEGSYAGGINYFGSNATTNHTNGQNVIINGEYHHTYGPPIGFILNGKCWLLGTYSHDNLATSQNYYSFQLEESVVYLDCCRSSGSVRDIGNSNANPVYVRNFIGSSTNNGPVSNY